MNDVALPRDLVRRSQRITFAGERRDFFRLVRRGALLELVTGGFYRFWLATDIAPEYSGTAKELLIGFLFALAILAPIYLIYFLIGIEAERAKAFASFPREARRRSPSPSRPCALKAICQPRQAG